MLRGGEGDRDQVAVDVKPLVIYASLESKSARLASKSLHTRHVSNPSSYLGRTTILEKFSLSAKRKEKARALGMSVKFKIGGLQSILVHLVISQNHMPAYFHLKLLNVDEYIVQLHLHNWNSNPMQCYCTQRKLQGSRSKT